MKKLFEVIKVDFRKLTKEDWDSVIIIAGDEGTGKSQLGLYILEWWFNLSGRKIEKDDIKYICLNIEQFVAQLETLVNYKVIIYDEAGELSNLRRTSAFNVAINLAYQIIRGKNILTVLILPSVFDLDAFFTKRRARALIQIEKRGKYAFFNKRKLRELMDVYQRKKNQYAAFRKVKPSFRGSFKVYDGVLKEAYKEKKEERMKQVVTILKEKLAKLNKEDKTGGVTDDDKSFIEKYKADINTDLSDNFNSLLN